MLLKTPLRERKGGHRAEQTRPAPASDEWPALGTYKQPVRLNAGKTDSLEAAYLKADVYKEARWTVHQDSKGHLVSLVNRKTPIKATVRNHVRPNGAAVVSKADTHHAGEDTGPLNAPALLQFPYTLMWKKYLAFLEINSNTHWPCESEVPGGGDGNVPFLHLDVGLTPVHTCWNSRKWTLPVCAFTIYTQRVRAEWGGAVGHKRGLGGADSNGKGVSFLASQKTGAPAILLKTNPFNIKKQLHIIYVFIHVFMYPFLNVSVCKYV